MGYVLYTEVTVVQDQVTRVRERFSLLSAAQLVAKSVIYGSSLVMALAIHLVLKLPDPATAVGASTFLSWWFTWVALYLIMQGVVVLTVTGGRNVGKDFLSILDILISLVPGLVLALVIYGNLDSPERHILTAFHWDIIRPTALFIVFDIIILGWLGARVSRLMGETHISNRG